MYKSARTDIIIRQVSIMMVCFSKNIKLILLPHYAFYDSKRSQVIWDAACLDLALVDRRYLERPSRRPLSAYLVLQARASPQHSSEKRVISSLARKRRRASMR